MCDANLLYHIQSRMRHGELYNYDKLWFIHEDIHRGMDYYFSKRMNEDEGLTAEAIKEKRRAQKETMKRNIQYVAASENGWLERVKPGLYKLREPKPCCKLSEISQKAKAIYHRFRL